jgi:hypothetical protein
MMRTITRAFSVINGNSINDEPLSQPLPITPLSCVENHFTD